ncbi:Sec15-domain-containing protein [Nadsonia fulvescens var. elongata DSM 6958]|uniref:Exocyst complex component SEC15 n=1 Tax=Nadsonia fulvescens var. elongata DSM 6958 TaxID=857566 RepID=A0A1E3PKL2_9ASCO|nr:Sec15-domain-containing protein [Nadsonia fulvescens var. elongata DSM 6958]
MSYVADGNIINEPSSVIPSVSEADYTDIVGNISQLLKSTSFSPSAKLQEHNSGYSLLSDDFLDQMTPILASAINDSRTADFLSRVDNSTLGFTSEIEKICSGSEKDENGGIIYLKSENDIVEVHERSRNLTNEIEQVGSELVEFGTSLVEKKRLLADSRAVGKNLDMAITTVTTSLSVLNLTNSTHKLIKEKAYFTALKSLEDLKNVHLKEVGDFAFAKMISKSVPKLEREIISQVLDGLEKWLHTIKSKQFTVGLSAFNHTTKLEDDWKKMVNSGSVDDFSFNSSVQLSYREIEEDYFSPLKNELVEVPFDSLYEALHVFTTLGRVNEVVRMWDEYRMDQKRLVKGLFIKLTNDPNYPDDYNKTKEFPVALREMHKIMCELVGFFILDKQVQKLLAASKNAFFTDDSDELFNGLVRSLLAILTNSLSTVDTKGISQIVDSEMVSKEPIPFVEFRNLIMTFTYTIEPYFEGSSLLLNSSSAATSDSSPIAEFLALVFKKYIAWLEYQLKEGYEKTIIEDDNGSRMVVENLKLYQRVANICWYEEIQSNNRPDLLPDQALEEDFPKVLPFSPLFPLTCALLRHYISDLHNFLRPLPPATIPAFFSLIPNSVDVLLQTITKRLLQRLDSPTRDHIVLGYINLSYLSFTISPLEKIISDWQGSGTVKLESRSVIESAVKQAESKIFASVADLVDDFVDPEPYSWDGEAVTQSPSSYLFDLTSYLDIFVSTTLKSLPPSLISFVYLDAFDHLSNLMMQILLDAPKGLTVESIKPFDNDLRFLEETVRKLSLANSSNNPETESHLGVDENGGSSNEVVTGGLYSAMGLAEVFVELRQCVNLLLLGPVQGKISYNGSGTRGKAFGRVSPNVAQTLLEKMEFEAANDGFDFQEEKEGMRSKLKRMYTSRKSPAN